MSFTAAKAGTWGVNEVFTSAQANTLDADHVNSLDKSAAGDTISGTVALAAGGSINANTAGNKIALSLNGAKVNATVSGAAIEASASGALIQATASGALIQATAAGALIKTATGGRISLGDSDYPLLPVGHSGRGRTIISGGHVVNNVSFSAYSRSVLGQTAALNAALFTTDSGGTGFIPLVKQGGFIVNASTVNTSGPWSYYWPLDASMHNGATLTTATLYMDQQTAARTTPALQPSLGIFRTAKDGASLNNALYSATNGFASFALGAGAYGGKQSLVYTPDQNNVIDTTAWDYYAIVVDESGSNALASNTFYSIALAYTLITDMKFQ